MTTLALRLGRREDVKLREVGAVVHESKPRLALGAVLGLKAAHSLVLGRIRG